MQEQLSETLNLYPLFFPLEKLLTCTLTALAGNNNIDTVEIINMKLKIKDYIYIKHLKHAIYNLTENIHLSNPTKFLQLLFRFYLQNLSESSILSRDERFRARAALLHPILRE